MVSVGPISNRMRAPEVVSPSRRKGIFIVVPAAAREWEVIRQRTLTLRRRLLMGALGVAIAGGILAAVLVTRSPIQGPETAGQPSVVPHLVPDIGGLHSGLQGTSSAPHVAVHPGIRVIPSAGGPVSAYGGAPSGATILPAHR